MAYKYDLLLQEALRAKRPVKHVNCSQWFDTLEDINDAVLNEKLTVENVISNKWVYRAKDTYTKDDLKPIIDAVIEPFLNGASAMQNESIKSDALRRALVAADKL